MNPAVADLTHTIFHVWKKLAFSTTCLFFWWIKPPKIFVQLFLYFVMKIETFATVHVNHFSKKKSLKRNWI